MKRKFENKTIEEYILKSKNNSVTIKVSKYIGFEIRKINNKNVVIYTENGNKCNKVVTIDDFIVKELSTVKDITDRELEKIVNNYERTL